MRLLVNQFDLKPQVKASRFHAAWNAFASDLLAHDLAEDVTQLMTRKTPSGYDTDPERGHAFLAFVRFRDAAQADAAWDAIETGAGSIGPTHRRVIAMVKDPVFTFWSAAEGPQKTDRPAW